jgi:SAM-dependent methyltransferase
MLDTENKIGGVSLDYTFYDGTDSYSEGDDAEDFILDMFKTGKDIRNTLREDGRFQIVYQLSPRRKNICEPMDISKTDAVLEIGAGMGAVTEGLAAKAGQVDCVDLSKRRSEINAWRNRHFDNITIYVGNFMAMNLPKQYDVIVLIGVLEYAQVYTKTKNPFHDFLTVIYDRLKPGGKIYIAIENRIGMRYFSGCLEDHYGKLFVGIEGYSDSFCANRARTFTKSELESLVQGAGYGDLYFYYPLPDYKLPTVIYSDDWLSVGGDILSRSFFCGAENFILFDDAKALKTLDGRDEFKMLTNSFLLEAKKR